MILTLSSDGRLSLRLSIILKQERTIFITPAMRIAFLGSCPTKYMQEVLNSAHYLKLCKDNYEHIGDDLP